MRPINADMILGMARAYMESRILFTAVELDLFTLLSDSPKTLDEAAAARGASTRGMAILLDALAAMGLLAKSDGLYVCPPEVAALMSAGHPDSILPMVKHSGSLWARWSELTDIVSDGKGSERPSGAFDDPEELAAFIGAMHVVGRHASEDFARQVDAGNAKNLLDVGGATGTYAEAFLQLNPEMRATVFDRPPVIEMARKRLEKTAVMPRVTLAAGDFYADPLPGGHDLVLLSAIIHQNSPEQNVALYRKCFDALVPGGRLIIRDHVLSPDRTRPVGGALFAVNMLAATNAGNCYTLDEIRETLETAGFSGVRLVRDGERMDAMVEAFRP